MYQIENPIGKAMNGINQSAGTYGRNDVEYLETGKTSNQNKSKEI